MDEDAAATNEMTRDQPLLFAGMSGKDVRIAVIDSGVHPDHPHIRGDRIEPGIMVMADGTIEHGAEAALDRLGHGTAVTAAIQEKAPDVSCLPIRVFRDSLKTSSAALIAAMRWAISQDVDIINLSLGSMNEAHRSAFAAVADEAEEAGVLLVAAREANDRLCYPGALPGVLGIQLDWDCPRDRYHAMSNEGVLHLFAAGYPRPIPGVALQRNLYGISFAVAQMSGFAALACEQIGGWKADGTVSPYEQAAKALLTQARA